jgi:hypothetical protein
MCDDNTIEGTFDDALGSWHWPDPSKPVGEGCQFMRMDKALIMRMMTSLLVTRYGKKSNTSRKDVESIEERLRWKMKEAKSKTDEIIRRHQKRSNIDLFPESYQCIWLLRFMQTSKFFREYVIMFRETAGAGFMIANTSRLQMVIAAEKKFAKSFRIATIKHNADMMTNVMINDLLHEHKEKTLRMLREYSEYEHRWVRKLSHRVNNVSLLDIWNCGNKKAFKTLVNSLRSVIIREFADMHMEIRLEAKFVNVCEECLHVFGGSACMMLCDGVSSGILRPKFRELSCEFRITFHSYYGHLYSSDSDENGDYWH